MQPEVTTTAAPMTSYAAPTYGGYGGYSQPSFGGFGHGSALVLLFANVTVSLRRYSVLRSENEEPSTVAMQESLNWSYCVHLDFLATLVDGTVDFHTCAIQKEKESGTHPSR